MLVTGAAGLLGSWLVPRLQQQGARVVVLLRDLVPDALLETSGDRARATTVVGDVADGQLVERVLAEYEIDAGDYPAARSNLVPVAYDPHAGSGNPMALAARELIERIDDGAPPDHAEAIKIVEAAFTLVNATASDKPGESDKGDKGA